MGVVYLRWANDNPNLWDLRPNVTMMMAFSEAGRVKVVLLSRRMSTPRYGAPEPECPRRVKSSMKQASSVALKDLTSYHVPPSDIAGARPDAPRLPSSNAAASGAVISTALWNRMPEL